MYQKPLLNLLTSLVTLALIFSQVGIVQAAKIDFGGEPEDNFWIIDTTYCKDGFSITATHTHLGVDGKAFWLELGSSSIPATGLAEVNLPPTAPFPLGRIAHGDGTSLINAGQPFTQISASPHACISQVTVVHWDAIDNIQWLVVACEGIYPPDKHSRGSAGSGQRSGAVNPGNSTCQGITYVDFTGLRELLATHLGN